MRPVLLVLLVSMSPVIFGPAAAEGSSCPQGYYPISGPGWTNCAPIPNYNNASEPVDPGPLWATQWGAVAIGKAPKGGSGFGAVAGASSKRDAKSAASKQCKTNGGSGCKVFTYHNQCVAVSWGISAYTTQGAGDLATAKSLATEACKRQTSDCRIFYSACSYPVQVK